MSHEGDEHRNPAGGPPGVPGVMTFGTPAAGEVLADRYRLEEHVDTDAAGRQIWRGIDIVLRRPVAVVIRAARRRGRGRHADHGRRRQPAGAPAPRLGLRRHRRGRTAPTWSASGCPASRCATCWPQAPLDAERATLVTHAIAEAVAALHAAGIVHGNVHPGTVLIADDGRVVLTDAHADAPTDPESDVRAVGAVLYACLTGHWPYAEAGRSRPARRGARRQRPARPARARSAAASRATSTRSPPTCSTRSVEPPPATALAAEFARLATSERRATTTGYDGSDYDGYDDDAAGPMGFADRGGGRAGAAGGKLALGVAVLTVIAVVGAVDRGQAALRVSPSRRRPRPVARRRPPDGHREHARRSRSR